MKKLFILFVLPLFVLSCKQSEDVPSSEDVLINAKPVGVKVIKELGIKFNDMGLKDMDINTKSRGLTLALEVEFEPVTSNGRQVLNEILSKIPRSEISNEDWILLNNMTDPQLAEAAIVYSSYLQELQTKSVLSCVGSVLGIYAIAEIGNLSGLMLDQDFKFLKL